MRVPIAMAGCVFAGCMCAAAQGPAAGSQAPARANVQFHEPAPPAFDDHQGFTQIFDGKTLAGWDGDPTAWRVENGAIVGESFKEKPRPNSYISYHGSEAKDFDLKLEIKVENGGGSGIQYRSSVGKPWIRGFAPGVATPNLNWMMTGPQADFWYPVNPQHDSYNGQFYSENTPLGIMAYRGQVVEAEPDAEKRLIGNIGDRQALGGYVRVNDWNQYEIIARGGVFMHILNGQLMAVLIDDDAASSNNVAGLIGLELEGQPSKVSVREIWLRKLK
jgi:hypothetical protein